MTKKIYINTLEPKEVIKKLLQGEEIHYNTWDAHCVYKIEKGILYRFREDIKETVLFPSIVLSDDNKYFEEEGDLICEPGLYKTKSGKKVFVSDIIEHASVCHGIIEGTCKATTWYLNGQRHKTYLTDDDIVDVWKDEE